MTSQTQLILPLLNIVIKVSVIMKGIIAQLLEILQLFRRTAVGKIINVVSVNKRPLQNKPIGYSVREGINTKTVIFYHHFRFEGDRSLYKRALDWPWHYKQAAEGEGNLDSSTLGRCRAHEADVFEQASNGAERGCD